MVWTTIRHAARRLIRSPGYSIPVIASLALGIGLNAAVFAELTHVLRHALPFKDADELVAIGRFARYDAKSSEPKDPSFTFYGNDYRALLQGATSLQATAAFVPIPSLISGVDHAEYVHGASASATLPGVLGIRVARGRWFDESELREHVVVISHSLWQRHFGADSGVIGQTLRIYERPYTVIGVMPPGPMIPIDAELWTPLTNLDGEFVARAKAGYTKAQVAAELVQLSPTAAGMAQRGGSARFVLVPLRDRLFGSSAPALRMVFFAALTLLLIACANVANLSLTRVIDREREIAVRTALGASRWAVTFEVSIENVLLAVAGAVTGCVLAWWGVNTLTSVAPEELSRAGAATLNGLTVVFALAISLAAAVLVSVAPVLAAADSRIHHLLGQAGTTRSQGRSKPTVRRTLASLQVAMAIVLIVCSGLLVRSVANLTRSTRIGFSATDVVTGWIPFAPGDYRQAPKREAFARELSVRLRQLPGVRDVAFGPPPLVGGNGEGVREGFNLLFASFRAPDGTMPTFWVKDVSPEYLDVFGVRLRRGRSFRESDDSTSEPVAILSASAAKIIFPDRDPIGLLIETRLLGQAPPRVVGVIDDILQRDLAMPANPEILLPVAQRSGTMSMLIFAVRGSGSMTALTNAIRATLRDVAPALATARLEPMQAVIDASARRHTFVLRLLLTFAALGATLATIGVYSVIAYLVTRRRAEMGIRMALGAQAIDVLALVMREGAALTGIGVIGGAIAALGAGQLLRGFLFEVGPFDPTTLVLVTTAFGSVALLAALIPARQATTVSPLSALRDLE